MEKHKLQNVKAEFYSICYYSPYVEAFLLLHLQPEDTPHHGEKQPTQCKDFYKHSYTVCTFKYQESCNFLTSWVTINISRKTLHHGVSANSHLLYIHFAWNAINHISGSGYGTSFVASTVAKLSDEMFSISSGGHWISPLLREGTRPFLMQAVTVRCWQVAFCKIMEVTIKFLTYTMEIPFNLTWSQKS